MKRIVAGIIFAVVVLSVFASLCISNNNTMSSPSAMQSSSTNTQTQSQNQIDVSKLHFYMFGLATCPHCKKMKQLLPEAFGKNSLTYYELQGNDHNSNLFSELYSMLGVTGVPVIGIFYDNRLVAIVEGEIPEPSKNVPIIVETAIKEKGVLFIADKTYLIPLNQTETIKKLENIFMNGEPSEG